MCGRDLLMGRRRRAGASTAVTGSSSAAGAAASFLACSSSLGPTSTLLGEAAVALTLSFFAGDSDSAAGVAMFLSVRAAVVDMMLEGGETTRGREICTQRPRGRTAGTRVRAAG